MKESHHFLFCFVNFNCEIRIILIKEKNEAQFAFLEKESTSNKIKNENIELLLQVTLLPKSFFCGRSRLWEDEELQVKRILCLSNNDRIVRI